MSKTRNIAFIGAGTISRSHAGALKALGDRVRIKAVCDLNENAAKELASEFGADTYADHNKMLNDDSIDTCVICLPHSLHMSVGEAVLKSGKNLFLEKPMALSVKECRKLMELEEKSGRTIFVGQTHQYRTSLRKAKEYISSGKIGAPSIIFNQVIAYYNWEQRKPWFLDPKLSGGGALFNTTPHQIDHMLFLIDSPVVKVRGQVACLRPGVKIDSDSMAFVEYENGARGVVSTFQGTKLEPGFLKCRVLGTEGSVQFNPFGNELEHLYLDKVDKIDCGANDPFEQEWREFLDAMDQGRKPATGSVYGHNVVAVLEAMVKSSETGKEVKPSLL